MWYTTEIPIGEGPWKLFGLPGLILRASDSKEHYVWNCIGINKRQEPIYWFPFSRLEKVKRAELHKRVQWIYKHPITNSSLYQKRALMSENMEVRFLSPSDDNEFSKLYNPIELE